MDEKEIEKEKRKAEEEALKKEISKRLVKAMKDNNIEIAAQLAEVLSSPHATANNYIKGRLPTMDKFSIIVPSLDKTNIRWIFTGEGDRWRSRSGEGKSLSDFTPFEILTYISANKEAFKSNSLTKKVFESMFIEEWMEELKREMEELQKRYEEKYGPID